MILTHDGRMVEYLTVNQKILESDMWRFSCAKARYRQCLEQGKRKDAALARWLALDILKDIHRDKARIAVDSGR